MQRRHFIGAGLVTAAGSGAGPARANQAARTRPIVLVHGASHGGWCWRPVAEILRTRGYRVFTPTLTGLGERAHLVTPDISLGTHIEDIASVIRCEELDGIVLVAHSYGGTVVTGVCDAMRERVNKVVFIDANTPADGQPTIPGLTRELAEQFAGGPLQDGYLLPALPPLRMGLDPGDSENIEWLERRLTPHPLQTLTEPIRLQNGGTVGMDRTFVLTTPLDQLRPFAREGTLRIKADPSWHYKELLVGHDAMIIAPEQTADLLDAIAQNQQ
jgi:pimeloyl-ACP methyl ester carboxylesterase